MLSIIQAAGWPIWPLLLCSVIALALIIERVASLRTQRVAPPRLLDEVLTVTRTSLPAADVVNKLAGSSVLGNVLASGLRAVIAEPRISEVALRDTFESSGRAAIHNLERYINSIGTIASAAPLLGLLGTVTGMIVTFQSITIFGTSDPKAMAGGISQALVTTVQGLCVAIPVVFVHALLASRVRRITQILEEETTGLIAEHTGCARGEP